MVDGGHKPRFDQSSRSAQHFCAGGGHSCTAAVLGLVTRNYTRRRNECHIMFRLIVYAFRLLVHLYIKLSEVDCRPAGSALFRAFKSAAAASIYCSPYYPLQDDLVSLAEKDFGESASDDAFVN